VGYGERARPSSQQKLRNLHSTRDRNPAADMDRDYKVTTSGLHCRHFRKMVPDISDITFRSRPAEVVERIFNPAVCRRA
jgi:hypothetical protein